MSRENPKPFKTIDEQVEILRSRGLASAIRIAQLPSSCAKTTMLS